MTHPPSGPHTPSPPSGPRERITPLNPESPAGREAAEAIEQTLAEIQVAVWRRQTTTPAADAA